MNQKRYAGSRRPNIIALGAVMGLILACLMAPVLGGAFYSAIWFAVGVASALAFYGTILAVAYFLDRAHERNLRRDSILMMELLKKSSQSDAEASEAASMEALPAAVREAELARTRAELKHVEADLKRGRNRIRDLESEMIRLQAKNEALEAQIGDEAEEGIPPRQERQREWTASERPHGEGGGKG